MPYQKGEGKSVVIALGGNALGNTPQEQLQLVKDTAKNIVDMVEEGTNVIVSHGNGPQVGMINNAFAYASANDGKTPEMPFPEAGAMSQGYIGYQLSQAILNDMKLRGIEIEADVMLKGTRVDGIYTADPEKDPTAMKFHDITYDEVLKRGLKVMDLTATCMCKENNLPIIVFDMDTVGNLKKVMQGEEIGTLVHN